MDNQQERLEVRLGWLGGAIDGEGCVHLSKRYVHKRLTYRPRLVIVNTDQSFCEEVIDIFNICKFPHYVCKRYGKTKRTSWSVEIQGLKRLYKALPVIIPYLISKRQRAEFLLKYIKYRLFLKAKSAIDEKDHVVYLRMRQYNGTIPLESSETIRTTHLDICEDIVRSA